MLATVITIVIIRAEFPRPRRPRPLRFPPTPVSSSVTSVKVTTVGNSLGIVLPREVLQRLRVDKGDQLYLVETRDGVELVPYQPELLAQIEALERTARLERTVLRGLAGRDAAPAAAHGAADPARLSGRQASGLASAGVLPPPGDADA